jgi:hypothetical protein
LERVEERGRLRKSGEQRGLGQVELAGVLREVRLRSRFDTVSVAPEIDLVEIGLEDAVFRPRALELQRQTRLLDLSLQGAFVADVEVANELLCDGRATLNDLAALDVLERSSDDALEVEPAVIVEAPVLDCDRPFLEPVRHLSEP